MTEITWRSHSEAQPVEEARRDEWARELIDSYRGPHDRVLSLRSGDSMTFATVDGGEGEGQLTLVIYDVIVRRSARVPVSERAPEAKLETHECRDRDGYGWNEGGAYLKTTCKTCNGSGVISAARTQPETSHG